MGQFKKILISILTVLLLTIAVSSKSYAATDFCDVEVRMYDKNLLSCMMGVPLTECDIGTSLAGFTYSASTGYGLTETVKCGDYFASNLQLPDDRQAGFFTCSGTSEDTCAEMSGINPDGTGVGSNDNWLSFYTNSRASGTLLGLAYVAEDFTTKEPMPANLAFYTNDVLSRVPIVNKTFAQTTDYGHSLINSILGVWKMFRNIAYALMALVLLYTGIIIILRRKINPQLVVTVQYALPRIVIAIILITFSYPIGATLGSLGWTLFKSGWDLSASMFASQMTATGEAPNLEGSALKMWYFAIAPYVLIGTSPLFLIMMVAIIVIFLIAGLVFNIKAIILYLKIIFSILTSPIEFALGAIPGNDKQLSGWFMRMAKYVLTLFLMGLIVPLGTVIAVFIAVGYAKETGGAGQIIATAAPLFVVLYSFGLGIGMEKRVEELLGLNKRK